MSQRLFSLNRCKHITQKFRIAGQRAFYLSVHDDTHPAEILLRVYGQDYTAELVGLYDVIARLMSLSLQYGAPLEKVGDRLAETRFAPCSPVSGHHHLKSCTSLPDLIGRHLLGEYRGRHERAHVPLSTNTQETP